MQWLSSKIGNWKGPRIPGKDFELSFPISMTPVFLWNFVEIHVAFDQVYRTFRVNKHCKI